MMKKHRTALAIAFIAVLAAAGGDAEAGNGRIRSTSSLQLKEGRITSERKVNHNRGLRGKLTRGFLGKTIAVETEQGATGNRLSTTRKGSRVSRNLTRTEDGRGTSAAGIHERRAFRIFGWGKKLERTDTVTRDQITQDTIQHRSLRSDRRAIRTHKRGAPNGVEEVGYREGTRWVSEGKRTVGGRSRAWGGKLKGDRMVTETPGGMRLEDTQTVKYGRLSKVVKRVLTAPITLATAILTVGIAPVTFGKTREVQLKEWQAPKGNGFELTTPNGKLVSSTTIHSNRTESVTTRFRKGVEREKETSKIWRDVGENERFIKDRSGRTTKIVKTRLTQDGVRTEWTTHLRGDDTVSKVVVKETRPRADKPSKNTVTKRTVKYPKGTRREDIASSLPAARPEASPVASPVAGARPVSRNRAQRKVVDNQQ
jgi:hypothetical protein